MIVTFVSQCEKNSLKRTRQVLDAYANRIGDNVWQTIITEEGLLMVKKLLRRTASKNTAVSCHWIRSRRRSELLWIVGNRQRFNAEGIVPVNRTKKSFNDWESPHLWQNLELTAVAVAIAGLFHDFGKANNLFQAKLNPEKKDKHSKSFEAYRHEWVSLRIFITFISAKDNEEWLSLLLSPQNIDEANILEMLYKDGERDNNIVYQNIFEGLGDFAKLIAWLIVSHHRLLTYPFSEGFQTPPSLKKSQGQNNLGDEWFAKEVGVEWNAKNHHHEWNGLEKQNNWTFNEGLPFKSQTWQKKSSSIAKRAMQILPQIDAYIWRDDLLTAHLARMLLVQADHYYSSQSIPNSSWQDIEYGAYANTDKEGALKQRLDEHNIGVAHHGYLFARQLPKFLNELPTLGINRVLERGIKNGDPELSRWQDEAVKVARKVAMRSNECGFFGINMASTGKGKTFANGRIMYALADEEQGCRFSIALGLRTLTLQTGKTLKDNLKLGDDEIATLIGSSAIQKLLSADKTDDVKKQEVLLNALEQSALSQFGSENLEDSEENLWVDYFEIEPQGLLKTYFKRQPKSQKLLHAPILVSTIDHLISATESTRGGKHIVPILRLLHSDLILDEPDELGEKDLPALCRLVHFTGLLGGKVLLSSATIPPAMAVALFDAYQTGRSIYQSSMSASKEKKPIICAWFDEFSSISSEHHNFREYLDQHKVFVNKRINALLKITNISHRAEIVEIAEGENAIERLSRTIKHSIFKAHEHHSEQNELGIRISCGVVRIANINTLVKISKILANEDVPNDYAFHLCVYHSRFTLAQRSDIEEKLDDLLNRKNPEDIWKKREIINSIAKNPQAKNHIFIVLATSVAEVGRDHDYDWAIAEPSSMRSLIQLAGRVQRHRKRVVETSNIFILDQNYRGLRGDDICYCKPGFESKDRKLVNKSMQEILKPEQYQVLNAIPAIESIPSQTSPFNNLVELEQSAYAMVLLGANKTNDYAALWWRENITWFGELQRRQRFRASKQDIALFLTQNEQEQKIWKCWDDLPPYHPVESNLIIDAKEIVWGTNVFNWFELDESKRYEEIAERLEMPLDKVYQQYGEVRIPDQDQQFYYHPFLGIYSE